MRPPYFDEVPLQHQQRMGGNHMSSIGGAHFFQSSRLQPSHSPPQRYKVPRSSFMENQSGSQGAGKDIQETLRSKRSKVDLQSICKTTLKDQLQVEVEVESEQQIGLIIHSSHTQRPM